MLLSGVVVEWREAVPQRLAAPLGLRPYGLMCHVGRSNATHHVRRFLLTALLGVPPATEEMQEEDAHCPGHSLTLTLWFHESRDKDGNPSNPGVRSQQLPPPSITSTEAAHPRITFGLAERVVSSAASTRSRRPLLITGFSLTLMPEISSNWRRRRRRTRRTRERSGGVDANWTTRTKLSFVLKLEALRPSTTKSRSAGRISSLSSSTAISGTFNTLQPSRSTKAVHCIPRTGLRFWLLRRRSTGQGLV